MNNETQLSTFARLLATENITVLHSQDAETASFNMETRVLTLPRWKVVDSHLYDMLVGHEVAHALWTDAEIDEERKCLAACSRIDPKHPGHVLGFLNIVEDARIERMIKNKFPGLRKDFLKGYTYLHNELDLFDVACDDSVISDMGLADRLNLHFKLGILGLAEVHFTAEEQIFVTRMENTKTWQDVEDLSRDLYIKAVKEAEDMPNSLVDVTTCDGDGEGGDGSNTDMESDTGAGGPLGSNGGVRTDRMNEIPQEKESRWNESDGNVTIPIPRLENIVIGPDQISKMWDDVELHGSSKSEADKALAYWKQHCAEWMRNESGTVKNLVQQFGMKKAADEHHRTMLSKTGRLDTIKMINHKWSEDIFAKNQTIAEGKNHGIVIFVDWSGSMGGNIGQTVKQAIILAMFAKQAGIPFEVYAFSDRRLSTANMTWLQEKEVRETGGLEWESDWQFRNNDVLDQEDPPEGFHRETICSNLTLFKFLHSDMNRRDFQLACEIFYCSGVAEGGGGAVPNAPSLIYTPKALSLCGTPLDETIVAAHTVVMNFRRKYNVQIMNTAFLTDGSGASNGFRSKSIINPWTKQQYGDRPEDREERGGYSGGAHRVESTTLLLKSLKDTTGTNLIGMHLHTGRSANSAYGWWGDIGRHWRDPMPSIERSMSKMYSEENFVVATGTFAQAYDEAYIINALVSPEDDVSVLPNASEVTHTKLRNEFVKGLKKKGMSRVLVRRFIEVIAR